MTNLTSTQKKWAIIAEAQQRDMNPQETLNVLNANKPLMWSWGARKFIGLAKGLLFTVSGHHHKGHVLINLAWDDTYTIRLISTQWNVKKIITNVYFDKLSEKIDIAVEKIEAYKS